MQKTKKNLNIYFEAKDLTQNEIYSLTIVKSLVKSVLEPIANNNSKALILMHVKEYPETEGVIKRLEYNTNVNLRKISDFEFSKFDIEEIGFIVLTSPRYNAALLFKEVEENKFEIYLKLNSKLVNNVYETIKSIFLIDYDDEFFIHKPERRDNIAMNNAIENLIKHFEETIKENEYNSKIQESYKTINETNTSFRNEIYQNVKQIAHEIKNQLSILDIYTRIFEKKTGDVETTEPIRKSVSLIKAQIEQFKNIDVVNLQEKNIKTIIQDSIKVYSGLLKEKNNKLILIDEMAGLEANCFVDEEKFSIVINNIIKNAHDSTNNDEIIIKLAQIEDHVKISIINHGEMIEKTQQEKIFEQGYTTKNDGWGVGLSVCKKFIGSQFGTFELAKSDESETIFTLTLPLVQTR
ncbi:MAG: HAMP domain-containing histidine kinase [Candidatus Gastranaerophilales bacterium]|nr:HAMP domain-containing histidine kinase [Candidatus Gastranaerophilales bacterium]